MTNELLKLDDLKATNLPELQGFKQKQEELVKECPFVEIIDNASYEIAKKHRTALLKGRTTLEAQDKVIASKLSNFRKDVKTIIDGLVSITLEHETKQQAEVKRFEEIKEKDRLERERLDELRIKTIKDKISELETSSYEIINNWGVDVLKGAENSVFSGMDTDFDFEEYDILFDQAKERVKKVCDDKINSITEKENQRIENEKLLKEKAESDAKLKEIEEQQAKEKVEREEKEKVEKDKVFEVRKNRLAEIGGVFNEENNLFYNQSNDFVYNAKIVFDADALEFENLLTDAKNAIQEAKDKAEKAKSEKEAAEKLEKENKAKTEKENKARVKRLKTDKEQLKKSIDTVKDSFISEIVFREFANEETENFRKETQNKIDAFFDELLTELENL